MDNVGGIDSYFLTGKKKNTGFGLNGYPGIHYQYVKIQIVEYVL